MFGSRLLLRPAASLRACVRLTPSIRTLGYVSATTRAWDLASKLTLSDAHSIHLTPAASSNNEADLSGRPAADLNTVLYDLAYAGRSTDLQRVDEIINDTFSSKQVEPSIDLYMSVAEGLIARNHHDVARVRDWLIGIPDLPGNLVPTIDDINSCLEKLDFQSFRAARNSTKRILETLGIQANQVTVEILIQNAFDAYQNMTSVSSEDLKEFIRQLDFFRNDQESAKSTLILQLFSAVGRIEDGRKLQLFYDRRAPRCNRRPEWLGELEQIANESGVEAALTRYRSLPPASLEQLTEYQKARLGNSFLGSSRSIFDLLLLDRELGPQYASRRWKQVISSCTEVKEMMDTYNGYKATQLGTDNIIAGALLRSLALKHTAHEPFSTFLSIYRDLVAEDNPARYKAPNSEIMFYMWSGLNQCSDALQHTSVPDELFKDMDKYGIKLNGSMAEHVICFEMKLSSTAEEAMQAYRTHKHLLTPNGYAYVLRGFVQLPFSIMAIRDYFNIVKDMQRAGFPTSDKVCTILLTHLGTFASDLQKKGVMDVQAHETLINATRRVHDQLTLDPSVTPSPIHLSQLINTYQRLSCFGDAYRVWELMYLTGTYNRRAISNILDGCGFARDLFTAKGVWNKLTRDGYQFDTKHWETYIECLCRCDQIDLAMRVLVYDMPKSGHSLLDSATIIVSFAKRDKRTLATVMTALETFDPRLYSAVYDRYKRKKILFDW